MKRLLMLGGLVALVAAGAMWWMNRPAASGGASQTPVAGNTDGSTTSGEVRSANDAAIRPPDEQPASERTATPASTDPAAGAPGARTAVSLAQLTDYRRLAAELLKLHSVDGGDELNAQAAAWPVDSDSLLAKYAALDKAGVAKVHADIHGLIEWQGQGPFENKQAELLPYRVMLALETERDWLQVRLGEL